MGWETRPGGCTYYYRKQRQPDGTVTSEYIGYGPVAELIAYRDGLDRHERNVVRLELEQFKAEQRRIDQAVDAYRGRVREVVRRLLRAAGFHQHKGQWRLKRSMTNELSKRATPAEYDEYQKLFSAAESSPTAQRLTALRKYAASHAQIFNEVFILSNTTCDTVIKAYTKNEAMRIHLRAEINGLKRSLGYAAATSMERLLIDDVALCWLRLQIMEQLYTQGHAKAKGDVLRYSQYLEGRLSATRRRYLQAMETLARVRGLLSRIGVQVNIAQQQIVQNG